jgi:D-amino-acid dehydrogenase
MKIIVLGAGIIGTSSAWFLHKAGHEVAVIDRQPGVAQETSFANGCQISVSHAEPWANPSAPLKVLKWLGKEDAPLLYRPRLDWLQWKWAWHFLRECSATRTNINIRQIVALCEYSRQTLQSVREETGISYDHLTRGILHFYTNAQEFEASLPAARLMRELGCERESVDADTVIRLEPALAHLRHKIIGGDYTATDESGDIYQFTTKLADKARAGGVQFVHNTMVTRLITTGYGASAKVTGVEIINDQGIHQTLQADAFVVAMGSFSAQLLQAVGVPLLVYPGKGYSATFNITDPDKAPTVSLTDDEYKIVLSRLGNRLRVAGTCELNGYTRELNPVRCEALRRRTKELFPGACDYDNPQYWTGLRPLTPSNVPYIGKTRFSNLYMNTGHGTLGWTMGCGSGKAIADIIDGKIPEVDFGFNGVARFKQDRNIKPII